jgi:hypothetical protein
LLTAIVDPIDAAGIAWWPIYREGEKAFLQHGLLVFAEMNTSFELTDPYRHIPSRQQIDEEGNRISEWCVSLTSIREFLDRDPISSGQPR